MSEIKQLTCCYCDNSELPSKKCLGSCGGAVTYCSSVFQKAHWAQHRLDCDMMKKEINRKKENSYTASSCIVIPSSTINSTSQRNENENNEIDAFSTITQDRSTKYITLPDKNGKNRVLSKEALQVAIHAVDEYIKQQQSIIVNFDNGTKD